MARTPIKLAWLEAVIAHLTADSPRPKNHSSILALAPVLVKRADPDGTNIFPGRPLMARESGLHDSTVAAAIEYLVSAGLLVYVGNRAHGRHEYRLEVAQTADHPDSEGSQTADHPDSEGSQTADQSADHPDSAAQTQDQSADDPGTYPRTTGEARARLVEKYGAERVAWSWAKADTKGGGYGLFIRILEEDGPQFEEQQRQKVANRALVECSACDAAGWLVDTDGEVIVPTVKCAHSSDPTPVSGDVVPIEAAAR